MPYNFINLQLFGDEGTSMAGSVSTDSGVATTDAAVNPVADGVATEGTGEQVAPVSDQIAEPTFDELIKGKYKKEYGEAVKAAVDKRFKKYQGLQGQIDSIDPIVRSLAQKYGVTPNADGSIPIAVLQEKLDADNTMYEKEAFERGMSVDDLKQIKALERENMMLRRESQRSKEQADWDEIMAQGEQLKAMYPQFDMDTEMQNPQFGRLLATFKSAGMPEAVRTAYETMHRDEIMSGLAQYAVKQTETKLSNAIQSGMSRPAENGTGKQAAAQVSTDPSKLTKAEIDEIKRRAEKGERITF